MLHAGFIRAERTNQGDPMTHKICICILAALTAAACTAAPDDLTASTTQALGTRTCATLYKDANFTGTDPDPYTVITNSAGLWEDGSLSGLPINDQTSSIGVATGCHIDVYQNPDWSDVPLSYSASTSTVPVDWNNQISAWSCYCVPQCGANQHYCGPDQGCVLRTQLCE